MSAPRVGVARIPRGETAVQVRFHRHRHALVDKRGRRDDDAAFGINQTQPAPLVLDTYPGRLPAVLEPLRDPALPVDPEVRP